MLCVDNYTIFIHYTCKRFPVSGLWSCRFQNSALFIIFQ